MENVRRLPIEGTDEACVGLDWNSPAFAES